MLDIYVINDPAAATVALEPTRSLLAKPGFRLLRTIPGAPYADTDVEDCFLFVLSRQNRMSAEQR